MIPFNKPPFTGHEEQFVQAAMCSPKISGDGEFSRLCEAWFQKQLGAPKTLLTPSCTHALEMAALLLDVQPGDEVIMPSYTFVSTANAFVLRGARVVFVDVRADTLNIDERAIEAAITARTKAIVVVHYAGVACEMDTVLAVARRHGLAVVEDAAQAMMSTYKGRPLGTFGALGAFSFHETKNVTSGGEGGLLIVNDPALVQRAEIIREKGTNRSQFFRGMVDKYSWVDVGSSYLPSDLQAAYLWGQLQVAQDITANRLASWHHYHEALSGLAARGVFELPVVPAQCEHNAHMFYMKVGSLSERTDLIAHLKAHGVHAVFHYVPLHSAPAGLKCGRFHGDDKVTTSHSDRLLRLPLWYGMSVQELAQVVGAVKAFYNAS
jgi:dTDP-4-amino-4,6-dideoxygalactose transaminase